MDQPTWIGRTLGGRYRIDALLGQGGMSAVYKATDPNLKRVVAVKLIHSHLSVDPSFVQRFESEASAVASLRHPNIVQVYDFNNDNGTYFMVLEFIPGETLQDRLNRLAENNRKLSLDEALKFTLNISDAVGYAHQRGMVHRDIKPANIMLDTQGQAILMDFGIVKILGGDSHTSAGAVVGTARYMSPESIRGEVADHRSDIYSLGVALYEMLSGRPPFVADSAMTLMMMHLNEPVPDVRGFRPDIHPDIVSILEKCLEKNRDDRYQSARELSADLKHALAFLDGKSTAVGMKKTALKPEATATIVEKEPLQTRLEPVPTSQSSTQLKPDPARTAQPKPKSNMTRILLAGGAAALLLCAVAGTVIFRNLSARNAPALTEEPVLETVLPSVIESTKPSNPTAVSSPTIESVVEVSHLLIPSTGVDEGTVVYDVESVDTSPEKRAPYGDSYDINLLERPFLQDMTYVPDLDISTFNIKQTEDWYYVSIKIVGMDPNNSLGIRYGVELDLDKDGFGDFLVLANPPYSNEWSTAGVQVFADLNHDTAGDSPKKSDAPFASDGYESLLFDGSQSFGDDLDLAWARIDEEHTIQISFKRSWAGESFMFGVLSDAGLMDVTQMDYTDRFTAMVAGSPVRSNKYYPLQSLYAVDTTCRSAMGFISTGYEPRVCPTIILPAAGGSGGSGGSTTPTGCQPPPGGCPVDAPNWWPDPHCACSYTPYNP
ncbi:MAG TPA: protein kinase [Anaerolineales bacterium]